MNYYAQSLNEHKLRQVYETNIPRVAQYLQAETGRVIRELDRTKTVLEFGAGYGRVLKQLAPHAAQVEGFDISPETVALGEAYLRDVPNAEIYVADVHTFETDKRFDVVLCVQNGLSAMKGAAADTVKKAVSLLRPGGKAMFSSYSENFWAYRLAWFQEQADKGLLGELDFARSIHGQIVCRDGFTATTHTEQDFAAFASMFDYPHIVEEVDRSSLFLIIHKA